MRSWTASVTRRGSWMLIDGIVVTLSVLAGLYLSSHYTGISFDIKFTPLKFAVVIIVHICSLIATSAIHSKTFRRWQTLKDDLRAIATGLVLATVATTFLFMIFQTHYKPLVIAISDSALPSAVIFVALSLTHILERIIQRRYYRGTMVLFVNVDPIWHSAIEQVRRVLSDDWRMVSVSLNTTKNDIDQLNGIENWGPDELAQWLQTNEEKGHKTLLVLAQTQPKTDLHDLLIKKAYGNLIPITNMVDFHEEILEKTPLFENEKSWRTSTALPRPRPIDLFFKRILDIVVGVPLFLIGLPVVVYLALRIRIDSKGPALFKQKRVGLGGKNFTCYKLRTMTIHDDDSDQWPNFEANKVTKIGHKLRDTGLDELPQLFNVLKGNMSFVGPRPARPKVTERHIDRLPYYAVVKSVKPGISGWAQLHQGQDAGDETMFEKTRYNLYYAKHFSIWLDILIYIRTFSQLINRKKSESVYVKTHLSGSKSDGKKEDKV